MTKEKIQRLDNRVDSFIKWIGSFTSLIIHSVFFVSCLVAGLIFHNWESILLILTTAVSLEAIYLSIFIQMTINRNTESLQGVEKDIDEIREDVEDIAEDVEEIAEDVEEIQEDDKQEDDEDEQDRKLLKDIQDNLLKITADLQQLKKKK